jgi:uncharacterized Zn ribbon protein
MEEPTIENGGLGEGPMPTCPKCGAEATFRDATGTFWDGQAHYWRETDTVKGDGGGATVKPSLP